MSDKQELPISPDLFEILRCPVCVREPGREDLLDIAKQTWLVCRDCGRKYPIDDGIPVMLIEVGDKFRSLAVDDLPVPPPSDY